MRSSQMIPTCPKPVTIALPSSHAPDFCHLVTHRGTSIVRLRASSAMRRRRDQHKPRSEKDTPLCAGGNGTPPPSLSNPTDRPRLSSTTDDLYCHPMAVVKSPEKSL